MIEGQDKQNWILGKGRTLGAQDDQSAYQSKLFGLWGIMHSIKHFAQAHHITTRHVLIVCDGLLALQQAQSTQPVEPTTPHYNLIGAIRQLKSLIPVTFSFKHVKGHQDSGIQMVLTQMAWMNIEMDLLAKAAIDRTTIGPQQYHLEGESWVCTINGKYQVWNVNGALQAHINTITIKEHWKKKTEVQTRTTIND